MAKTTPSPLLKSSLRLPPTRAPSQTYQDQDTVPAYPSFLGKGWLYVEGKKNRASFGKEGAPAGRTCTPQGQYYRIFLANKGLTF